MKKLICATLLILTMLFTASCQNTPAPQSADTSSRGTASSVPEISSGSAVQENPDTQSVPESSEAEVSESDPEPELQIGRMDLSRGEHAVSDGEYLYFTVHSDDDPSSMNPEIDGLYRADLSMENVIRLARGDCHSLALDDENVYFCRKDSAGTCAVCSVDKQGSEIRRIVTDAEGAKDVGISDGKLFYVCMYSLYIVEDPENGIVTRLDPDGEQVLQAAPGDGNTIWFTTIHPNTLQITLRLYEPDNNGSMWGVVPIGNRFTVNENGTVFYTYTVENQPDYEDYRQYEYLMMRMNLYDDPHPTQQTGRFGGDFYAYGPYLFYTKFTEVREKAGNDYDSTVRKLYCYDTETETETALALDGFIGIDMTIRSVTAGRLFFDALEYDIGGPYDTEFCDCRSCDLAGGGKTVILNTMASSAPDSPAVQADDIALEEFIAQREREKEEELRNEPYGPGTSYLYLKASETRSACFRLVRMDGTTQFMILLSPGEETTQSFPNGRYTLKVARGETWISDEEAFGPSGSYSTTDVYRFESGATYQISTGTTGDFRGDSQKGFTE